MLSKIKMRRNQKGFTLIELMIVIAIIGILAAVAIPQFAAYRTRGFNSSALSDARNLSTSQATFYGDWSRFGVTNATLGTVEAAALLTGPTPAYIQATVGGSARSLQIPLGSGVSAGAKTDAGNLSFNAAAKHLAGDTIFGVTDASSAVYFNQTAAMKDVIMSLDSVPVSTTTADNFVGAATAGGFTGNWAVR